MAGSTQPIQIMESPVLGLRLSEDQWLALNTLPFIFRHLEVLDLLRCSEVCRLWHTIAKDPSLWRSVILRNYILHFTNMSEALAHLKTVHLRIEDCKFVPHNNLYKGLKNMPALRILEMPGCSSSLIKVLNEETPNLEVIRAHFMFGSIAKKQDLSFIYKMSNLYELKLHLRQGLQDIEEVLINLGHLKHLHLLGVYKFDFRISHICRLPKSFTLETLALGGCYQLTRDFCVILKSFTALKELRLDLCTNWNTLHCLTCISEISSLVCLELIDVDVDEGFPDGLNLCTNLKQLTIFPKSDRFNMGIFNARIFMSVMKLKPTLKKFTLGFRENYLNYCQMITGIKNQVPVSRDLHVNKLDPYRHFVQLDVIEDELKHLLPYTDVNIAAPGEPRSVFS